MKRPKTGGRTRGTPNKATAEARAAIAAFIEGNAHRLQGWLDNIANGTTDEHGKYIVRPDPAKAFEALISVVDFHVPRIARAEHTGADGGPIETHEISDLELARRVLFDMDVAERKRN